MIVVKLNDYFSNCVIAKSFYQDDNRREGYDSSWTIVLSDSLIQLVFSFTIDIVVDAKDSGTSLFCVIISIICSRSSFDLI